MKDLTKLPYWTEAETLDALCFHDSEEHHARWDELLRKLPPGAEHADENNRRKATLTAEGDALVRKRNEAQKLLSYAVLDGQLTIKKLDGEKLFRPAEVAQWVKDHHAADFPKFPKNIQPLDDDKINEAPARAEKSKGCTKQEILAAEWPPELEGALGDIPEWLLSARVSPGRPGRNGSAIWNPAQIAVCLVNERRMTKNAAAQLINRCFQDFVDDWNDKSEML